MTQDPKNPQKPPVPDGGPNRLPTRNFAFFMMLLALTLVLLHLSTSGQAKVEDRSYHELKTLVEKQAIKKATVVVEGSGSQFIVYELKQPGPDGAPQRFRTKLVLHDGNLAWIDTLPNLEYDYPNPMLRELLWGALPFLLIMVLLYFFFIRQMRSAGKGAMSFGKSRAKLLTRDKNKITFKDVAGVEEAEEEVQEIIEFLKDPKRFQRLGGRIPKGVLLSGPPGTGKTLLAKAIAGEAEVPFFSISGSDFVEMFVGVGASRVRDMFEQGKRHAPCIIFIDEIDAVGRSRFSGIGGGHDEREQTLNALLVEMDGFDTQEGVIIIAATNRPDVLDNALLRPGRFDRQIVVDLPTLEGRAEILKIHAKNVRLGEKVQLMVVARGTPGFSGADLSNLMNEAALLAARRGAEAVEMEDLEEARDKVRFGRERKSRMMDDEQKKLTAYHEAGHAIVLEVMEHAEPVHKVTIIPRGSSLGSTMWLPEKDEYTLAKKKLIAKLVVSMGGRAAEELALDDISSGAVGDIESATRIAHAMVCSFGMNESLGPQAFGGNEQHLWLGREVTRSQQVSEATAQRIDEEISKLLKFAHSEALRILTEHRTQLDTMARVLIERETIDGRDVREIVRHNRILSPEERKAEDDNTSTPDGEGGSPVPTVVAPAPVHDGGSAGTGLSTDAPPTPA